MQNQDAGLNGRGVHLTDTRLVSSLTSRGGPSGDALRVFFHGTHRQWEDRRRPWIRQEKDRAVELLRAAGVMVEEHSYFEGKSPSLRQHFEIINAMKLR